jgi:hypothetical protein
MQLFGLARCPQRAVARLCRTHLNSQLRETTQILATALFLHDFALVGPVPTDAERGDRAPYKPAYKQHCIVRWAAACGAHFEWVLAHARALSATYTEYFDKTHLCHFHIEHCAAQVAARGYPPSMPSTIAADAWLATFDPTARRQLDWRICDVNAPLGCAFGVVALDMVGPRQCEYADWVASYEAYYEYKCYFTFKRAMQWGPPPRKRARDNTE